MLGQIVEEMLHYNRFNFIIYVKCKNVWQNRFENKKISVIILVSGKVYYVIIKFTKDARWNINEET